MEKIQINYSGTTSGASVMFFSSELFNNSNSFTGTYISPSYVILDNYGHATGPYLINNTGSSQIYQTIYDNQSGLYYGVSLSSITSNYITGGTIRQIYSEPISIQQQANVQNAFNTSISNITTGLTHNYVFFNYEPVNDYYVNLSLKRSINMLDTLKVYHIAQNSPPNQDANTGVVIGRISAIQNIKDATGNLIKIPLKNVAVGIFNPGNVFQDSSSYDANGDRFSMNFKEYITLDMYNGNQYSFNNDLEALKSFSGYSNGVGDVQPEFKYVTRTKNDGSFVLYNVPATSQNLIFEIDLFQNDLTKEEIILNRFAFPSNNNANLDNIPSLIYRSIPIEVFPCWGNSALQTGYTEVNIAVNCDLRKWTTHIFPQVSMYNQKVESSFSQDSSQTVKIAVRDMTQIFGQNNGLIQAAQITDDLSRDKSSEYLWLNQMTQQNSVFQYPNTQCYVLKLPANIYDANGYKTDRSGIPTLSKGTWLSSYEFKISVNDNVWRKTGSDIPVQLGTFPYEQNWSVSYPVPYTIPEIPNKLRYSGFTGRNIYGVQNGQNIVYTDDPQYSDGELINLNIPGSLYSGAYNNPIGGFFAQQDLSTVSFFPNRLANVATSNGVYLYESATTYANGYNPNSDAGNTSSVLNGELYQRLECGYGYLMIPQGWPRVVRTPNNPDYDAYFDPDYFSNGISTTSSGVYPSTTAWFYSPEAHPNDVYNLNSENISLSLDENVNIPYGGISIYRIIESGNKIVIPSRYVIPTFINVYCAQTSRCLFWQWTHTGEIAVPITWGLYWSVENPVLYNDGNGNSGTYSGQTINMYPGGWIQSYYGSTLAYTSNLFPANASFNPSINAYSFCNYSIAIQLTDKSFENVWNLSTSFSLASLQTPPQWYVCVDSSGSSHGVTQWGLSDDFNYNNNTYTWSNNGHSPVTVGLCSQNLSQYNGGYDLVSGFIS